MTGLPTFFWPSEYSHAVMGIFRTQASLRVWIDAVQCFGLADSSQVRSIIVLLQRVDRKVKVSIDIAVFIRALTGGIELKLAYCKHFST